MINWEENEGSYDEVMPLLQSVYSEGRENPKVPNRILGYLTEMIVVMAIACCKCKL